MIKLRIISMYRVNHLLGKDTNWCPYNYVGYRRNLHKIFMMFDTKQ